MTLSIPVIIGNSSIADMKNTREILRKSFSKRNEIVHGSKIFDLKKNNSSSDLNKLYFELKNTVIKTLLFYIANDLYLERHNRKINHELMFELYKNKFATKKNKTTGHNTRLCPLAG